MNEKRKFVVLFHKTPEDSRLEDHWDLMLESDGQLETWSLSELPGIGKVVTGRKLSPHRLEYLTYEGPVSGNRGVVQAGCCQVTSPTRLPR